MCRDWSILQTNFAKSNLLFKEIQISFSGQSKWLDQSYPISEGFWQRNYYHFLFTMEFEERWFGRSSMLYQFYSPRWIHGDNKENMSRWGTTRWRCGNCQILAPLTNNFNAQNEYGQTPIHSAAYFGHTEIVKILVPLTDNPNASDKDE